MDDCPICKRLKESEVYAKHYADFYVHRIAEKEGRTKAAAAQEALQTAGIKVSFADAFCAAYKAAYEREYAPLKKDFWNFFTEWDYHTASPEDKCNACCYHDEGFGFHYQFSRHPSEDCWDKETITDYSYEDDRLRTRSGRIYERDTARRERLRYHRCRVEEQLEATADLPAGTPPPPPVSAEMAAAGTPPLWQFRNAADRG